MEVMGADGIPGQATIKTFGKDISKEDLTDLFATCVFCFNHAIDRGPSATELLELSVIRLRLTRWGEAVKIYDKTALCDASPNDLYEAREALADIIILFDSGNQTPNGNVTHLIGMDNDTLLLQEALGSIASERFRQGNSLVGPQYLAFSRWSNVHSRRASSFIDRLENLFGSRFLRELCAGERLRIDNKGAIKLLRAVANGLDPWVSKTEVDYNNNNNTIFNVASGHQFNNTAAGNPFPGAIFSGTVRFGSGPP